MDLQDYRKGVHIPMGEHEVQKFDGELPILDSETASQVVDDYVICKYMGIHRWLYFGGGMWAMEEDDDHFIYPVLMEASEATVHASINNWPRSFHDDSIDPWNFNSTTNNTKTLNASKL